MGLTNHLTRTPQDNKQFLIRQYKVKLRDRLTWEIKHRVNRQSSRFPHLKRGGNLSLCLTCQTLELVGGEATKGILTGPKVGLPRWADRGPSEVQSLRSISTGKIILGLLRNKLLHDDVSLPSISVSM